MPSHPLSIAPMLDYTDTHARYFLRLISRHALLYTEMITTPAILRGHRERQLHYNPEEHPVAIQLGGSEPAEMAQCARIAEDYGYDEINMNVGCPSDRVKNGQFGACLMANPETVAECVAAMKAAVTSTPITVKHRIGIDHVDSYEQLHRFVDVVSRAGCEIFIVHARKAWLSGLSPKENREIPPLRYEIVYRLKRDFPRLQFVVNGGIKTLDQAQDLIRGEGEGGCQIDGAMIGREAYHNPYILHDADTRFYDPAAQPRKRTEVVEEMLAYIARRPPVTPVYAITRHMLGLFHGENGARAWRQRLSVRREVEANWQTILTELNQGFQSAGL